MKFFYLLVTTLLCCGLLQAQEPQYTWGKPLTNYNGDRQIIKLLEQNEEGFILHSKQGTITNTTHHLEFYSANLDLVRDVEVQIDGGIMGNMNTIQQIENINGQNYLFSRNWNKSKQKHSFYIAKLNDNGSNNGFKLLDDIAATKINNSGFFTITLSEDQSQLLLLSELPAEKKMQEKIRFKCFESTAFNEVWTKDITLKTPSQKAPNNDVRIDNEGNVFLFKTIRKLEAFYELFVCKKGNDWTKIPLELSGKVVTESNLQFDSENNFHLNGLYTNKFSAYKTIVHGRFYVHLNKDLKPIVNLSKDLVASDAPEFAMGNNLALDNYHLKDVLFRSDGKLLLLLEQLKYDSDIIAGSSPIQSSYKWEYGPLIVLCMEPSNGEILWTQGFVKDQENQNTFGIDQFGSAVYYLHQDRLYIYWNNTSLSKASIPPAFWKEPDGTRYVKHKAFNIKTAHATFLRIVNPDGTLAYDKKFGLPLFNMHEGASFEMSMNSHFYFPYSNGIVIRAEMHNGGQRYRWGLIGF